MSKQEHDKDDNTTPQGGAPSHNGSSHKVSDPAKPSTVGGPAKPGDASKPAKAGDSLGANASNTTSSHTTSSSTTSSHTPKSEAPSRFSATGANTASAGGGAAGTAPAATGKGGGGRNGLVLIVLLVLILLLLAGLVWGGWRLKNQQQELDSLSQQVQGTQTLKNQLQGQLQSNDQAIGDLRDRLESTHQSVERVLKDLAASQKTDSREWLYAEVEYLLRLANQRLQLERDVEGAQSLLQAADERLQQADNPAFLPVRREIHSELAALDSVPDVDRTGIYLQLGAEAEQLSRLPLSQDTEALSAQVDDGSTYSGGWRAQLARVGNQLKDLVTVRHHDKALEALITPEQEGYLRQNVRLQLEQAQLALLKGEPRVYRASIARASDLVESYYKTDNDGVQKVLGRLDDLAGKTIHPELPDISASLTQLRNVISQRFGNQNASGSGQNASGGKQNASGGKQNASDGKQNASGGQRDNGGAQNSNGNSQSANGGIQSNEANSQNANGGGQNAGGEGQGKNVDEQGVSTL